MRMRPIANPRGPLTERSLNWLLVGLLLQVILASPLDLVANDDPPRFTITDLGPYEATSISNDGQILGNDYSGPWLWRNGARVALNGNGLKKISSVSAVNRSGHVAGARLAGDYLTPFGDLIGVYHACLWSNGEISDLGTLGGGKSAAL